MESNFTITTSVNLPEDLQALISLYGAALGNIMYNINSSAFSLRFKQEVERIIEAHLGPDELQKIKAELEAQFGAEQFKRIMNEAENFAEERAKDFKLSLG